MTIEIHIPATEAAIAEGEAWVGVRVYGLEYSCRHINGELRVDCVSGQRTILSRPRWQRNKNFKAVCDWFSAYIDGLGAEYHEAHRNLYSLAA